MRVLLHYVDYTIVMYFRENGTWTAYTTSTYCRTYYAAKMNEWALSMVPDAPAFALKF
jgi:hypothetical protein